MLTAIITDSNIYLSSTKSQTGHLLGAAGAVEAIYSILTLKNQIMPCSMNIDVPIDHENIELVSKNKNASEKEIRDGLEGNICRCTGYHNIVKSVKAGAEKMGV